MKVFSAFAFSIVVLLSSSAFALPKLLWEVTEGIDKPESAYYDSTSNSIFVSNVAGDAGDKDGKGWITQLTPEGKILQAKWVEGLSAPKGLRAHGKILYVTNIDEVVAIDIPSRTFKWRVTIPGAKFLNDLTVTESGTVLVSDTFGSTIYQIKDGHPTTLVTGPQLESPNGLHVKGKTLWVAAWGLTQDFSTKVPGKIFSLNLDKPQDLKPLSKTPLGNLDGLERTAAGDFLVSDWVAGKIYQVDKNGNAKELISGMKGPADIGWIQKNRTLLIPVMDQNRVSAYKL